jgi:hypothetical protein
MSTFRLDPIRLSGQEHIPEVDDESVTRGSKSVTYPKRESNSHNQ